MTTIPIETLLHSMPFPSAVLDGKGTIIAVNTSWKKDEYISANGIHKTGNNFIEQCIHLVKNGHDNALKMILAAREVLDDHKTLSELIVPVEPKRWLKLKFSKLHAYPEETLVTFDDISGLLSKIEQLQVTEERYRQNFNHSISGIILGTPDGKILDANPAACQMLGYTRQELLKGGRDMIVDTSDPQHLEMIQIRKTQSQYDGEKEYIHKNGHIIPIQITSVTFPNTKSGETHLVLNTFRDISSEKGIRKSLEKEQLFSQTTLNSIPGLFFVVNEHLQIVKWNQSVRFDLGFDDNDINQMKLTELFYETDKQWTKNVLGKIFKTGKGNFIAKVLSKNGELFHYNFHISSFDSGDESFLVATAVDITNYKISEHERLKNLNLLTQLFENSPLAMVMIDPDNIVQRANRGFISLFGYSEKELTGKEVNKLIARGTELDNAKNVSSFAFRGDADQQETVRYTKNGEKLPVIVSTVPVFHNGRVIAAYGIYVDLTDQKRLENSLQNSLDEKDLLLQEIHHRVKNNLAVIAGLIELQMAHESNDRANKHLQAAYNRIFSIAKIYETLYQQNNLTSICFEHYIDTLLDLQPFEQKVKSIQYSREKNSEPLLLNINQAVPLGLILNEFIQFHKTTAGHSIKVHINRNEDEIDLTFSGVYITPPESDENSSTHNSFTHLLIDTFLNQLDGSIQYPKTKGDDLRLSFTVKHGIKGSGSALDTDYHFE